MLWVLDQPGNDKLLIISITKTLSSGGQLLAQILKQLAERAEPGLATQKLEDLARKLVKKAGAKPAFLGYQNFPAVLCTSVNNEVVHCVPSSRQLKQGDILGLDLGIKYQEYFFDAALTVPVGEITPEARRLIRVCKKALKRGLKKVRAGNTTGDIGNTIQRYVESQGFSVIRDLCGHGIGKHLHEAPQICNFGQRHKGNILKQGQLICLEPMISAGDWRVKRTTDNIGWQTADSSLSAHFEHMVLVKKDGCQVLTKL